MASIVESEWDTTGKFRLDELENVYVAAHVTNRGLRWGTDQLNRSMFLTLVAQFQTYCRDLHDQAVEVHVANGNPRLQILPCLDSSRQRQQVLDPARSAPRNVSS